VRIRVTAKRERLAGIAAVGAAAALALVLWIRGGQKDLLIRLDDWRTPWPGRSTFRKWYRGRIFNEYDGAVTCAG